MGDTLHRPGRYVTAFLAASFALLTSAASAQTAEEIIAASITASGGEAALSKVASVTRQGRLTIEIGSGENAQGTATLVLVPRAKVYRSAAFDGFEQKNGWDGATGWENGLAGLRKIEGDELALMRQESFLNLFLDLRAAGPADLKIESLADEKLEDQEHHVLSVSGKGLPTMKVYIDQTSFLVKQQVVTIYVEGGVPVPVTLRFEDYRPFGGVTLPGVIAAKVEGLFSSRTAYTDTVLNVPIDPSLFAMPE